MSKFIQMQVGNENVFPLMPCKSIYLESAGTETVSLENGFWLIYQIRYGSGSNNANYMGLSLCLARYNGSFVKEVLSGTGATYTIANTSTGANVTVTTTASGIGIGFALLKAL